LACALAHKGQDVHVIFTRSPLDKISVPRDLPYKLSWALFFSLKSSSGSFFRSLNAISVAWKIRSLTLPCGDCVVHSNGEEGVLVPVFFKTVKWFLTPRFPSYPSIFYRDKPNKLTFAFLWITHTKYMLLRKFAVNAELVCPTSRSAADMVTKALRVPPKKITVVSNGIKKLFFSIKQSKINSDAPIIFFGRLEQSKGLDTLLNAYANIRPFNPLLIIGSGTLRNKIKKRAADAELSDCVKLLPWSSDTEIANLMSEAIMVVLPSREESFGNSIAETIAAGVPLISTRVGAVSSIVDEEFTTLVDAGNCSMLEEAMRKILINPDHYRTLALRARERLNDKYSWDKTAKKFLELYTR
jgi:glycosyltransferase involved in cell wall biosynthesis